MSDLVFHLDGDAPVRPMVQQAYESEDLLQRLIERHPAVVALGEAGEPSRWLLVGREVPVAGGADGGRRWSLDHLLVGPDAVPTLVECKRASDTRARREVVAQMLDYAANAVAHWRPGDVRAAFERTHGDGAAAGLAELLGGADGGDGVDPTDADAFWRGVDDNLRAERVRLVFVADRIPPELRRVVEFLNGQMDPAEVLALELRQFLHPGGTRTLVPRVVGATMKAAAKPGKARASSAGRHDWASVLDAAADGPPGCAAARERLRSWAEQHVAACGAGRATARRSPSARPGRARSCCASTRRRGRRSPSSPG